jgi:uncharacterized protein YbjQ (UPF0145 family)
VKTPTRRVSEARRTSSLTLRVGDLSRLLRGREVTNPFCQRNAMQSESESGPLIVTTGNDVTGRRIRKYLGVVRGIVVRSPNIAQGFFGSLKQLVGGNIEVFANVCETARQEAFERMVKHALEKNADAVIAMRYDATEFSQNVTEVLAYGTAVQLTAD